MLLWVISYMQYIGYVWCRGIFSSPLQINLWLIWYSRESGFSYTISSIRYLYNLRFTYKYLCAIDIYFPPIQLHKVEWGLLRYYFLYILRRVFIQVGKKKSRIILTLHNKIGTLSHGLMTQGAVRSEGVTIQHVTFNNFCRL